MCGNLIAKILDSGVDPDCCGREMKELAPEASDSLIEHHLPCIEHVNKCTYRVKIGATPHPMTKEHRIMFIYLETEHGGQLRYLSADGPAEADFSVCEDKPVAAYAYCNKHGLWRIEL